MPKKSEGGWSGIGMANSGIDPTHVYFLNDHPTQIPPSEILGPIVQNCQNLTIHWEKSPQAHLSSQGPSKTPQNALPGLAPLISCNLTFSYALLTPTGCSKSPF